MSTQKSLQRAAALERKAREVPPAVRAARELAAKVIAAAAAGDVAALEALLASGGQLTCAEAVGMGPLHHAAKAGHAAAVSWILEKGGVEADVHDASGKTALMWAAEQEHLSVMAALLDRGAAIDAVDSFGCAWRRRRWWWWRRWQRQRLC